MTSEIKSVDEYVGWVFATPPGTGQAAFYRGHSKGTAFRDIGWHAKHIASLP